ncbi:Hypothetical protein PHPALM_15819 [Phytophthora palmivora]|uniref:COMM domain-containing protein n=1 Tax=Phytophthora palmivora TaxID=4796 RepID=A0A2P4XRB8_9STRA|nr:Hypothetical protein PHPALM_15819 [Phytophthora palmivora]
MSIFAKIAREWRALDVADAFVAHHLDSAMQLAVALYCQHDADAERAISGVSSTDQRDFMALSMILRRLVEVAVREHLTFLLPSDGMTRSASLQAELARHETIVQSLPDAFALRFRQLLETHWGVLTERSSLSLPRVQELHWSVGTETDDTGKRILVRLQTSDGATRRIHVPVRQFHQLRHSVASVLQEMNDVEAHPMMRLAYMEQSRHTEATSHVP